jgi:hypothetical protein
MACGLVTHRDFMVPYYVKDYAAFIIKETNNERRKSTLAVAYSY